MKKDILWKGIIEEVFDDLLRFVFPKASELFSMNRKFSFMDKELGELFPEPDKPSDTRLVDKLVQVHRRDGGKEFLLVHLEVQGNSERDFPERMFRYYYRIFDRWRKPVTAIAIFTGADGHRIPDRYEHRFFGTELKYKYNVLRIVKYDDRALETSTNLFARIAFIAKRALLAGRLPEEQLLEYKKEIASGLLAMKDLPRRKVVAMLRFLDNYIVFEKKGTNRIFTKHVDKLNNKLYTMTMLQAVREYQKGLAKDEGRREGRKEQREKIVKRLLAGTNFSNEKIAKLADVSVAFVKRLRNTEKPKKAA